MRKKSQLNRDAIRVLEKHLDHFLIQVEPLVAPVVGNADLVKMGERFFHLEAKKRDMIQSIARIAGLLRAAFFVQ